MLAKLAPGKGKEQIHSIIFKINKFQNYIMVSIKKAN